MPDQTPGTAAAPAAPPSPVAGDARRGRQGTYRKGVARRQEILDRAIVEFARRGADGTSLRRIADAIGISHATLLHYFDSREQLLVEVHRAAEERQNREQPLPAELPTVDMMAFAAQRNLAVPGMVQLYSTLVASAIEDGNEEAREHFTARFAAVRDDLARRLEADQRAGRIRDDVDVEAIASLLIAASDGLQIQWLLDGSIDLVSVLEQFGRLLTTP